MSKSSPQHAEVEASQELTPLPGTLLLERLRGQGPEPWLFFRRAWHWRWRSYAQMADQVRRGADAWRRAAESAQTPPWAHFHGTQHPDTFAYLLVVLSQGGAAVLHPPSASWPPSFEGLSSETDGASCRETTDLWLQTVDEGQEVGVAAPVDGGPPRLLLPAAAGQLESRALEPLRAQDFDDQASGRLVDPTAGPITMPSLGSRAAILARHLDASRGRKASRPILCVSPRVAPVDLWPIAWATLLSDAVWILEPQTDAFAATAAWARPTVAVASTAEEERALHRGLVATPRRHRRLRRVLVLPAHSVAAPEKGGDGEPLAPQLWRELGVERVVLGAA